MSYKVVFLLAWVTAVCAWDQSPSSCACGRIYTPVCASNGITYSNMCEFKCGAKQFKEKFGQAITMVFSGRCDGSD